MPQNSHRQILKYIVAAFAIPTFVAFEAAKELFEFGEEINLQMTGGRYSGKGSLSRKETGNSGKDYWVKFFDWLRPPDYSSGKFRQALRRADNKQFIDKKIGPDGKVTLCLTEAGKTEAYRQFPFFRLANKPWKGWWVVVTFDIPESQSRIRKSIRQQLLRIGFAQWQKSVYVSPHDISDDLNQMIKANNLQNLVVPMIAKRILAGDDWEFAKKLFGIDGVSMRYNKITADLKKFNGSSNKFRKIFADYLSVLTIDPFLPIDLAPKGGYGREVAFEEIKNTSKKFRLDNVNKTIRS